MEEVTRMDDDDERFHRLMEYLDTEVSNMATGGKDDRYQPVPPSSSRVCLPRSPISKHLADVGSPTESRYSRHSDGSNGKRYVWDEVGDDDHHLNDNPTQYRSRTNNYLSPPRTKKGLNMLSTSPGNDVSMLSSHGAGVLSSPATSVMNGTVDAVRKKIDAMKDELRERSGEVRELQAELARIGVARDRRAKKYESHWNDKLTVMHDEQSKLVKRNTELLTRLQEDVKQLETKEAALAAKLSNIRDNAHSSAEVATIDAQRRREKTRRQWEADERTTFEKIAAGKSDGMKVQAAKSLGAKLDALVIRGKQTVNARSEELENKLTSLKVQLQSELDANFTEAVSALQTGQRESIDNHRKLEERKIVETKRRHEAEIVALRERLYRTRKAVEEKSERARVIDADAALETVRAVKAAEAQQVTELTERHQRELSALMRSQAEDRTLLEKQLREESQKWRAERQAELQEHVERIRKRKRDINAAKAAAETERVVSRLRTEADADRRRLVAEMDAELEAIREQAQSQMDTLRDDERRALERLAGLKSEVDALKRKIEPLKKEEPFLMQEIAANKALLRDLRISLREVEAEVSAVDGRLQLESQLRNRQRGEEHSQWEEKLADALEHLKSIRSQHELTLHDAQSSLQDEQNRIEAKVGVLLQRKDTAISDLEAQLANLRQSSQELEERLEKLRNDTFK